MAAAAQERVRRQLLSASSRKERPGRQPTPPTPGHGQIRELPDGGRSPEPVREHPGGASPPLGDD
eukprot:5159589-Pyramimonas_sp.AAC.1